ncbi:amphi-Trp domain-containing protein [Natronomonas sp. CBA1123]|jgi:amphi-Trp domain-containing protein|uniref:amphi-Trp domain-containing protein n=1 Tax=Natronomonas sp. CBA1123 TaxID=2668070 RepID=UPI0012EA6148|nr:amphi-Trp domain-containing protein [Natronomonas sp. CBA1123]MUV85472.1 amphi-Trp domain-containing protein [Natronomonas sp. CBA1123]
MPEEVLFKTEQQHTRSEIAEALVSAAEQIESGTVQLESDTETQDVAVPETPRFEVELERLTDSETGEERYELEYEIRWTK